MLVSVNVSEVIDDVLIGVVLSAPALVPRKML